MVSGNQQLVLSFVNASGEEIKINIRSPAKGVTADTISQAMDRVVAIGAFSGQAGEQVKAKKTAYFINKVSEPVNLS